MFTDEYQTFEGRADAVIEDRGSRFVAAVMPVDSLEKSDQWLTSFLAGHPDRLDFVAARRIGLVPERTEHSEGPKGVHEAVLAILVTKDITNALIAVVRAPADDHPLEPSDQAYRDAALNALRRAKVVKRILYDTLEFDVPREDLDRVTRLITDQRGKIIQTLNGPRLIVSVKVRKVQADELAKAVVDSMNGRVTRRC